MYLLLYVEDILTVGKSSRDIEKLKNQLKGEFNMKDLGNAKRILSMDNIEIRLLESYF